MVVSRGGSPDKVLLAEALATLDACADMCMAAASPDTSLDEAMAVRRTVRVQLDIAARLIFEVRRASGIMAVQAPAAGAAEPSRPPAAGAGLRPGRDRPMARYDSSGFSNPMPGTADVTHGDSNLQGSTGSMRPASDDLGAAHVSWSFDSSQGGGYSVPQGSQSTANDSDPMRDPVSGTVTPPAVVAGATVAGPHHPNAGR